MSSLAHAWRHQDLLLVEAWWCLDVPPTMEGLRTAFAEDAQDDMRRFLGSCVAALKGHLRRRAPALAYRRKFTEPYRRALAATRFHEPIVRTAVLWNESIRVNGENVEYS